MTKHCASSSIDAVQAKAREIEDVVSIGVGNVMGHFSAGLLQNASSNRDGVK